MAVLSAVEIYRVSLAAGFTPDQAVTMTAVALAESGGNSLAHNSHGEDSRGLYQINAPQHPAFAGQDLYDPLTNARAAFAVSHGGRDISPWTTTHGGGQARYLTYQSEAETAARLSGNDAHGMWAGTQGYGHTASAGGGNQVTDQTTPNVLPPSGDPAASGEHAHTLSTFLSSASAQVGDPYVWGAQDAVSDPNPHAFDCSSLVEWAAGRAGVTLPRTAQTQYLALKAEGMTVPVEQALHTPGALLFRFSSEPVPGSSGPQEAHVAISMGDGVRVVEAQNSRTGVIYGKASDGYTQAAVIPGISDGVPGAAAHVLTTPGVSSQADIGNAVAGPSSSVDATDSVIADAIVRDLHLTSDNTDPAGPSDRYELIRIHTNPVPAAAGSGTGIAPGATDPTRVAESLQIVGGSGLTGEPAIMITIVDSDQAGLSERLAALRHLSPTSLDAGTDRSTYGAATDTHDDATVPQSNPFEMSTDPTAIHGPDGAGPHDSGLHDSGLLDPGSHG